MLKMLLTILIFIDVLIFALMIYCLTGVSFLFPGLGLVVSGGLVSFVLLLVEIFLVALTFFLYRRTRGGLA